MAPDASVTPRRRIALSHCEEVADSKPAFQPERMVSHRLLLWSELPEWQREDNSHVESGYRVATPSVLQCLKSWLYLHNESGRATDQSSSHLRWPLNADRGPVNIFSHLFGAALFFALPFILYRELSQRYATASTGNTVVFALYLFGVATCFVLSVTFHTLMSHSAQAFAFGIQLDFQGIILLMWSATAPMVYYTFYTEPTLQKVYWSLVRHCKLS
jgi:adiponectin receptor